MARRRALVPLGIVAAFALVLAGCGQNDYRYVNNSAERAFFRVPTDYKLFRIKQATPTERPSPLPAGSTEPWHVVFDSSPEPSVDHADETAPDAVVGQALIIPLAPSQGEAVSAKDLRSFFIGQDPIDLADSGDPTVEIVAFDRITTGGGLRGSKVVMNIKDGTTWGSYAQVTLMDDKASRAYLFDVRCSSECFKSKRTQIDQIIDSWQVRK